jgi:hypothetical protein
MEYANITTQLTWRLLRAPKVYIVHHTQALALSFRCTTCAEIYVYRRKGKQKAFIPSASIMIPRQSFISLLWELNRYSDFAPEAAFCKQIL